MAVKNALKPQGFRDSLVIAGLQHLQIWGIGILLIVAVIGFIIIGANTWKLGASIYEHHFHTNAPKKEHPQKSASQHAVSGSTHNDLPATTEAVEAATNKAHHEASAEALQSIFMGIEFLMLSPLCFLVLRSLSVYVNELSFQAMSISEQQDILVKQEQTHGKEGILDTKALIVGLLLGIVATHLVGELLNTTSEKTFELSEQAGGLVLLGVLAVLYLAIEHTSTKVKDHCDMLKKLPPRPSRPGLNSRRLTDIPPPGK